MVEALLVYLFIYISGQVVSQIYTEGINDSQYIYSLGDLTAELAYLVTFSPSVTIVYMITNREAKMFVTNFKIFWSF